VPEPAKKKSILVGGVWTSYIDAGAGDTIVALHGIPTSSALFEPLIPFLASYRFIAPDLLGQGDTESPAKGSLGFSAYCRHVDAFLDAVPPPSFHLLVHDLGGVIGLLWASERAERIRSITVLSTTVS
jgi:haloalkane dehalogenase